MVAKEAAQVEADQAKGCVDNRILSADLHHPVILEAAWRDII